MRSPSDDVFGDDTKENEKLLRVVGILTSRAMIDEDPLARKHALYMLGTTGDPCYTDIFIQSLYDPEKAVRSQATVALARIGTPVVPKVIELLNDKDWKVRYRAAEVLGLIKCSEAVPHLIGALSDKEDHVRYMAAKSLGKIKNPTALDPLRKCRGDENPYVQKMVEESIAIIEGKTL
jgi:HEAT repeat protein